jgi:hypothetical protein
VSNDRFIPLLINPGFESFSKFQEFIMKLNSLMSSVMPKASLVAIVLLSLPALPLVLTSAAHAAEFTQPNLVAQNNPFNNVDDGFMLLIIDTMRTVESAKKAMKSNDPEVKAMAEQTYNTSMKSLQSMMSMWMKKFPDRTITPHGN